MRRIMSNLRLLRSRIDKYEVISFDVFDTLVKRNVSSPKIIFEIVKRRFEASYGVVLHDFVKKRREAERIARNSTEKEEITLEEIYEVMHQTFGIDKEVMKTEIAVEIDYCRPNYFIKNIFEYCIQKKKRVIIISDMYLPCDALKLILKKCGYFGYEKLYLSSEIFKTKRTGTIYKYVISDLSISKAALLHIGDNYRSDLIKPMMERIHAYHIERDVANTNVIPKETIFASKSLMLPILNNNILSYINESEFFRLGYELLGPLLVGFCSWIYEHFKTEKYDRLFFLARDMFLVIQAYQKLTGDNNITYLEVSRKSLRNSYIREKGNIKYAVNTMSRREYKVLEMINSFNINTDDALSEPNIRSIIDLSFNDLTKSQCEQLNAFVMCKLEEEEDLTYEYLKTSGLMSGNNCIIDIGWHGTIQNMLEAIINKPLSGLYFGNTKRNEYFHLKSEGYWFDEIDENKVKEELSITYILEVMLFPPVGTTLSYAKDGSTIYAVHENVTPSLPKAIVDFQKGALRFVDDYCEQMPDGELIDAEEAVLGYKKFSFSPSWHYAKIFGNLNIEDGKIFQMCSMHKLSEYIKNPKTIFDDYASSRWKEGYIKCMFPMIYDPHRIACLIKKRRN